MSLYQSANGYGQNPLTPPRCSQLVRYDGVGPWIRLHDGTSLPPRSWRVFAELFLVVFLGEHFVQFGDDVTV